MVFTHEVSSFTSEILWFVLCLTDFGQNFVVIKHKSQYQLNKQVNHRECMRAIFSHWLKHRSKLTRSLSDTSQLVKRNGTCVRNCISVLPFQALFVVLM